MEKEVFYGIVYYSTEMQQLFTELDFKTVPYVTVSLQKQKRLLDDEFYKEEDKWLLRSDEVHDA
eukprot:CAMPEP_0202961580 /NCGR_PEP_ID=MMETSP1396-20130829/5646_1 /ASSEMBLY_ACC=CAM_ASM_000872 /TAXON_ID= /ORGANISM="Pseudokeronopsis sp., Strain Brazil" /LENGTH=63 /DNA_ID=CAMNT_0049681505 /DNA_START=280 /DNA_END=471 /DNA_ORIENTATION=-